MWLSLLVLLALQPSTRELLKKGDLLHDQFRLEEALPYYEKAFSQAPNDFDTMLKLARAFNDVGERLNDQKDKSAEKYFRKALEIATKLEEKYPNKAQTQFYLAVINGNLGDFGGPNERINRGHAVEKYAKRAIEIDPRYEDPYVVLGAFYRETSQLSFFGRLAFGKSKDATLPNSEQLLKKAVQLQPKDIFAHFELAKTYEAEHRDADALAEFKKVMELPNVDPRAPFIKGLAHRELEKKEKNAKSK